MASNIQIAALGETNMPDNNTGFITPAKMRELFGSMLTHLGGNLYWVNNDTAYHTIPASVETQLTFDFVGGYSVDAYRPAYITTADLIGTNAITFDGILNASFISIRVEFDINHASNSKLQLLARMKNSSGTQVFDLQFEDLYYKSAATASKTSNFFIFMDEDIQGGSMELYALSDNDVNIKWKSLLIDIR